MCCVEGYFLLLNKINAECFFLQKSLERKTKGGSLQTKDWHLPILFFVLCCSSLIFIFADDRKYPQAHEYGKQQHADDVKEALSEKLNN